MSDVRCSDNAVQSSREVYGVNNQKKRRIGLGMAKRNGVVVPAFLDAVGSTESAHEVVAEDSAAAVSAQCRSCSTSGQAAIGAHIQCSDVYAAAARTPVCSGSQ